VSLPETFLPASQCVDALRENSCCTLGVVDLQSSSRCKLIGLPLSNTKLKLSAFTPFIAKANRYLAGWQASLLNPMGRTVLINSVLDSQLVYLMCALPIPPGTLAQVDQRRRAFLWTGEDTVSGASCLVAWEHVCADKEHSGLDILDLSLQNTCLLLKLLHRLHQNTGSSWASWVRRHSDLSSMQGEINGQHWSALQDLLPVYRAITSIHTGNGNTTSFWFDVWVGDEDITPMDIQEVPPLDIQTIQGPITRARAR